ncbi:MAG: coniferyl aldehyde dehydrogenase [Rhodothalassiaceae bacterium]
MATHIRAEGKDDPAIAQMQATLAAQKKAFLEELPVSLATRRDRLSRAIALLVDRKDELVEAMDADFSGRPKLMSLFTDIASSVKALKFARKHVKTWMKPERRRLEFPLSLLGARGQVEYQPKGVVGLISPWNFPVNLTFGPLAGILAAGNRVMIKPSEITPATSDLMARLIGEYFDRNEIATVTGGPEIGQAFSALPFDHLLFTGATSVGRHVMRAAAENLTPVTLELGGKSPVIVSRSADLARMAERVIAGKMMNAGQICLAPDYILAPRDRLSEVREALMAAALRLYPTAVGHDDYAAIVNRRHRDRLLDLLKDARAKGARVTEVTPQSDDAEGSRMPLHIVEDADETMRVMQDEIFGPILPLLPYDGIDDAIAFINAHDRPLGLYWFGTDRAEMRQILDRTVSGGVTVNDVVWHVAHEDLPFGGIGPSGMGAYHGREGFLTFSHAKSVYRQTGFDLMRLAGALPPYGDKLRKTLKLQIRK